jgi:hypothetical protein
MTFPFTWSFGEVHLAGPAASNKHRESRMFSHPVACHYHPGWNAVRTIANTPYFADFASDCWWKFGERQ